MIDFWGWVLDEGQQEWVPPSVLAQYDGEFKKALDRLIRRTQDPVLKAKFKEMIDCPVRSVRTGRCYGFSEYILSSLLKHGVQDRVDVEAALAYVVERMLMPTSDAGDQRVTVFDDFDEKRPSTADFNPLQARFLKWLQYAVNNVKSGRIPRVSKVERRPHGTVSIGQGRWKEGDPSGGVSPDEIAARTSTDADMAEIIDDITTLLKSKEAAYPLPLAAVFQALMAGQRTDQQVKRFGDRQSRMSRRIIVQTVQEYAEKTGNYALLTMLKRYEGFQSNKPMPAGRTVVKAAKPRMLDKDRDFASLISVIDRFRGQPVGTAQLGSARRRWLEYPPRNPSSDYRNRLEEVLAQMSAEGVLKAIRTSKGAFVYSPGPRYDDYRQSLASAVS